MLNIFQYRTGLQILPVSVLGLDEAGELQVLSSDGKIYYHDNSSSSALVTENGTATLTNKTISAGSNSISNISDANISLSAAINSTKIANGSVSNIEFQYLDGVTSPIQTQFNTITGSAITSLTGDVSATGPGASASTVNSVGGSTASNIHLAELLANAATNLNTASTIVKRDGSNMFHLSGLQLDGSTSGAITLQAADTTSSYSIKMPGSQGTANQVLTNDGSGNLSWGSVGTITRTSTDQGANRLQNKDLDDSTTAIVDSSDTSKKIKFDAAGSTGTSTTLLSSQTINRILTLPNATDTLVGKATVDVFSNKTFSDAIINAQISTPSTPSANFNKLYFKADDNLYIKNSSGVESVVAAATPIRSVVWVQTGNGYGAVSTAIRRFSTISQNTGTAISYADTANLGGTFTINEDGVYSISYADGASSTGNNFGISLNSTHLTTSIQSLSPPENQGHQNNGSSSTSVADTVVVTTTLSAGDIIRAHGEIGAPMNSTVTGITNFRITKVNV